MLQELKHREARERRRAGQANIQRMVRRAAAREVDQFLPSA